VYKFKRGTDVLDRFAKREVPGDISTLSGDDVTLALRQENFTQEPRDVYAVIWSAAGGFGDPLERDPERVRTDVVEDRCVSASAAREIYGVVIGADGRVDEEATRALRANRREVNRRKDAPVARIDGTLVARLTDSLDLRRNGRDTHIACAHCRADLGLAQGNYKDACVRRDADIRAANPNIGDYRRYIDDRPVFRQFFCPGCGALIENEVARESDPVLQDIELDLPSPRPRRRVASSPRKRERRRELIRAESSPDKSGPAGSRLRGNDEK
jgi:N-methylhydantoinase B